jgi:hypothetical protein
LQYKNGKVKIGKTGNPSERIKCIINHSKIYSGDSFRVVKILISQPHTNYNQNEKILHSFFQEFHCNGEVFNTSLSNVINKLQNFDISFKDEHKKLSKKSKECSDRIMSFLKNQPVSQPQYLNTNNYSKAEFETILKNGCELVIKYVSNLTHKEINGNALTPDEELYMQKVFLATNELIHGITKDLQTQIKQQNKIINLYTNGVFYK